MDYIKGTVTRKIAFFIFVASFFVTLALTAGQLVYEYNANKSATLQKIDSFEKTLLPTLANAVWTFDEHQLRTISSGLIELSEVQGLRVFTTENPAEVFFQSGKISTDRKVLTRTYQLPAPDQPSSNLGRLEIDVDIQQVQDRTLALFWSILISQLVRTLLVSVFIYLIIDRVIIQRLSNIESAIQNASTNTQNTIKNQVIFSRDEINDLHDFAVQTFTKMKETSEEILRESQNRKDAEGKLFQMSMQIGTLQSTAGMFHDINNLLMVAMGQASIIKKQMSTIDSEYPDKLNRSLNLIKNLIRSQQEASRNSDKPQFYSVYETIQETLILEENSLKRASVKVDIQVDPTQTFYFSKSLFMLALLNLIKNAREAIVLAEVQEGRIEIKCECSENYWKVSVTDNGPGVSEAFIDKLFLYGETTKTEGHGFGISNCKKALQLQDGDLTYQPANNDQGACFTIMLPLNAKHSLAA